MIDVRPIRPDEWERFRDLRLRSLKDAPDAFGSTLEAEALLGFDKWKAWVADRPERKVIVAEQDGKLVGTASASPYQERKDELCLFAMWVDPSVRRAGVGRRIVEAIFAWAATTPNRKIVLFVTEQNPAALALYRALGFAETGERLTLREGVDSLILVRALP